MPKPQYNGRDIPIFTVRPNWAEALSLITNYSTIVQEGLDGSEERIGRQPRCLYGLRFTTLPITGQETGYIRRVIELAQAMPVGMPVWTEQTRLTAPVTAGALSLAVEDTEPTLWGTIPDYALVYRDWQTWEILKTEGVDGEHISLEDAASMDWPAGTLVLPVIFGHLPRGNHKQITDEHGIFQVDFHEVFLAAPVTDMTRVEHDGLPDLPITYGPCQEWFEFSFEAVQGDVRTFNISNSRFGPFGLHIILLVDSDDVPTGKFMGTRPIYRKTVRVNNDYKGECWFSLRTPLDHPVARPLNPVPSEVEPPTINITLNSYILDASLARPLYGAEGFTFAYSWRENPWINNDGMYIVPRRRLQRNTAGLDGDALPDVVNLSGEPDATHKFTTDNTIPDPDSINGNGDNLGGGSPLFKYQIQARSFKGSCASPVTLILVDKRVPQLGFLQSRGTGNAVTGACDLPKHPGDPDSSSASCSIYGGTEGFETHILKSAIDASADCKFRPDPPDEVGGGPMTITIIVMVGDTPVHHDVTGEGLFAMGVTSTIGSDASIYDHFQSVSGDDNTCQIRFSRNAAWDGYPPAFNHAWIGLADSIRDPNYFDPAGTFAKGDQLPKIASIGGTSAGLEGLAEQVVFGLTPYYLGIPSHPTPPVYRGAIVMTVWDVCLTAHNDDETNSPALRTLRDILGEEPSLRNGAISAISFNG